MKHKLAMKSEEEGEEKAGMRRNTGLQREYLNVQTMGRWTATAFIQGLILYGMGIRTVARFDEGGAMAEEPGPDGRVGGLYADGFMMYTALIFTMQFKVAKMTSTWTACNLLLWVLSFCGYFAFCFIYALFVEIDDWYKVPHFASSQSTFWLGVLFITVTLSLFDFVVETIANVWFPTSDKILLQLADSSTSAAPSRTASECWQPYTSSSTRQQMNLANCSSDYLHDSSKPNLREKLLG